MVDVNITSAALFVTCFLPLSLIAIYFYRIFISVYSQFPEFHVDFQVVPLLFAKRKTTILSLLLQKIVSGCQKHHSDGVCTLWLFHPFVAVCNEEFLKLISWESAAADKLPMYALLADGLGEGLVTSNGEKWRRHRNLFNPLFRTLALKDKIPVFNRHAQKLVEELTQSMNEPCIELSDAVNFCTFGVICETITGLNICSRKNDPDVAEFFDAFTKCHDLQLNRMLYPWLRWRLFQNIFLSEREYKKCADIIKKLPEKLFHEIQISYRRNKIDPDSEDLGQRQKSFAHALVKFHLDDPAFTVEDAITEIKTFLIAGFNTLAYTIIWCIFLLGHHPDIQEQTFNKLNSIIIDDVTYEDTNKLTFLECVIMEALRLYPTIPMFGRLLKKDVHYGKYKIPKNSNIVILPHVLYQNPEIYPNPQMFDPDRFRKENLGNHPSRYISFAEGSRNCIGKKFSIIEMKVILAHIIRKFKITTLNSKEVDFKWSINLSSAEPIKVKLHLREP